jgi:hypothetical protein
MVGLLSNYCPVKFYVGAIQIVALRDKIDFALSGLSGLKGVVRPAILYISPSGESYQ